MRSELSFAALLSLMGPASARFHYRRQAPYPIAPPQEIASSSEAADHVVVTEVVTETSTRIPGTGTGYPVPTTTSAPPTTTTAPAGRVHFQNNCPFPVYINTNHAKNAKPVALGGPFLASKATQEQKDLPDRLSFPLLKPADKLVEDSKKTAASDVGTVGTVYPTLSAPVGEATGIASPSGYPIVPIPRPQNETENIAVNITVSLDAPNNSTNVPIYRRGYTMTPSVNETMVERPLNETHIVYDASAGQYAYFMAAMNETLFEPSIAQMLNSTIVGPEGITTQEQNDSVQDECKMVTGWDEDEAECDWENDMFIQLCGVPELGPGGPVVTVTGAPIETPEAQEQLTTCTTTYTTTVVVDGESTTTITGTATYTSTIGETQPALIITTKDATLTFVDPMVSTLASATPTDEATFVDPTQTVGPIDETYPVPTQSADLPQQETEISSAVPVYPTVAPVEGETTAIASEIAVTETEAAEISSTNVAESSVAEYPVTSSPGESYSAVPAPEETVVESSVEYPVETPVETPIETVQQPEEPVKTTIAVEEPEQNYSTAPVEEPEATSVVEEPEVTSYAQEPESTPADQASSVPAQTSSEQYEQTSVAQQEPEKTTVVAEEPEYTAVPEEPKTTVVAEEPEYTVVPEEPETTVVAEEAKTTVVAEEPVRTTSTEEAEITYSAVPEEPEQTVPAPEKPVTTSAAEEEATYSAVPQKPEQTSSEEAEASYTAVPEEPKTTFTRDTKPTYTAVPEEPEQTIPAPQEPATTTPVEEEATYTADPEEPSTTSPEEAEVTSTEEAQVTYTAVPEELTTTSSAEEEATYTAVPEKPTTTSSAKGEASYTAVPEEPATTSAEEAEATSTEDATSIEEQPEATSTESSIKIYPTADKTDKTETPAKTSSEPERTTFVVYPGKNSTETRD